MFAVEVYAAVRHFVMIEKNSQRDAARVFGLSRETISKMCRFSLPPDITARQCIVVILPIIACIWVVIGLPLHFGIGRTRYAGNLAYSIAGDMVRKNLFRSR